MALTTADHDGTIKHVGGNMLGGDDQKPWLVLEYRASCDHPWRPIASRHGNLEDAYEALRQLWGPRTEVQAYIPADVAARHQCFNPESN